MGYFYWLQVKNSDHLHTELSLGYLKNTKFYFHILSSIASFTLYAIFDCLVVGIVHSLGEFRG